MTFRVMYGSAIDEDLTADYKAAARFSDVRIGSRALYFPVFPLSAEYIPLGAVDGAWVRKKTMSIKGCCAGQIPVFVLHLRCGSEFSKNLTFDRKKDADRALELLKQSIPDLTDAPAGENN